MARAEAKDAALRIVDRAVQVATRTQPRVIKNVPIDAASATWPETDDNGDIHNGHYFMLGVDELGDQYAPLRVAGESDDYGE